MAHLSASSTVLWFRDILPSEQGYEYLRGAHAQVVARIVWDFC